MVRAIITAVTAIATTAFAVTMEAHPKDGRAVRPGNPLAVVTAPVMGDTTSSALPKAPAVAVRDVFPALSQTVGTLPPLDLTDMALWNWNAKWTASNWDNAFSPIPWRYNHIQQPNGGDTYFTLDANGSPQLQAVNGTPAYNSGLWETDVTLPQLKDGLIVAPLWLYNSGSKDEIDFEFAGRKGLDVSIHAYPDGVEHKQTVRLFAGEDFSGRRMRFGIKVDEYAGVIQMFLNGQMIQEWDRQTMPFFVSHRLKPWMEMWAANPANSQFSFWAGQWAGLAPNEALLMTVHGYRYTSL